MTKTKTSSVLSGATLAGAIVAAGAAFIPGAAEAHCGQHAGTCGQWDAYLGGYCVYEWGGQPMNPPTWMEHWGTFIGYCTRPVANCSPGATCPCAQYQCENGAYHGCSQTWDWETWGDYNPC